jgi:hypothetical protein
MLSHTPASLGDFKLELSEAIPDTDVLVAIDKFSILDKVTAEGDLPDITCDSEASDSAAVMVVGIINP